MPSVHPLRALTAALALAALALAPATAAAQQKSSDPAKAGETPNIGGKKVFDEAVQAMNRLDSLRARVSLSGEGAFQSTMPRGDVVVTLVRADEPSEQTVFNTRVDGDYTSPPRDTEALVLLARPDAVTYVNHGAKRVETNPYVRFRGPGRDAYATIGLLELTESTPYRLERAAETAEIGPREVVNGALCDVVTVTYGDLPDGLDRMGGNLPQSRWYFAVEDRIPRRIQRISNVAPLTFTLSLDITDVEIDPAVARSEMEVFPPDGYDVLDRMITARQPQIANAPEPEPESTPRPTREPAPAFTLVDADGNEVTKQSTAGRVSVMYFWGTWCVPCRGISPEVSAMTQRLEGKPVDVYGVAVREATADAPREYMEEQGYAHTLLVQPGEEVRSTKVARDFGVRVYPTIVVVGAEGEIVASVRFSRDTTPAELVGSVESIVGEYLEEKGLATE